MKVYFIILIVFCSELTSGQKYDTINGKVINCRDKSSFKQGYWQEYNTSKILTTDSFNHNPKAIGFHNDEGLVYTPIAEGYYKDNKKVGTWTYYEGFYNDPYAHLKTVIFTDSGFRYEIDSFYHYKFKVSNDSSFLSGKVFLKNEIVDIRCKNGKCAFLNPFTCRKEYFKQSLLLDKINFLNFRSYKVRSSKKHT